MKKYISQKDYCLKYGVKPACLNNWIARGKIRSKNVDFHGQKKVLVLDTDAVVDNRLK